MPGPRRALVVVDVQNDFCEGGSLAVVGGTAVAAAIGELLSSPAALRYDVVVATRDWHVDPGRHFASSLGGEPDYVESWPDHCVAGTPGAELHPLLVPALEARGAVVFDKGERAAAYSGFEGHLHIPPPGSAAAATLEAVTLAAVPAGGAPAGSDERGTGPGSGTGLAEMLRAAGIDAVTVCGIATDFCVKATALDALAAGFEVELPTDLCAAVSARSGESSLAELASSGVSLVRTRAG